LPKRDCSVALQQRLSVCASRINLLLCGGSMFTWDAVPFMQFRLWMLAERPKMPWHLSGQLE
jgi:hypothetical protein